MIYQYHGLVGFFIFIFILTFRNCNLKYELYFMKQASYFEGDYIKNLVKENRKKEKSTQRELAEKVGVTERTIISIEKGKYIPSIVLAYKLAQVFGTDIESLFCLKEYLENEA